MNRRKLHDYILHFKSGLFAKNNFEDWIWETQFKIEYFYNLTDLKSTWNNPLNPHTSNKSMLYYWL